MTLCRSVGEYPQIPVGCDSPQQTGPLVRAGCVGCAARIGNGTEGSGKGSREGLPGFRGLCATPASQVLDLCLKATSLSNPTSSVFPSGKSRTRSYQNQALASFPLLVVPTYRRNSSLVPFSCPSASPFSSKCAPTSGADTLRRPRTMPPKHTVISRSHCPCALRDPKCEANP